MTTTTIIDARLGERMAEQRRIAASPCCVCNKTIGEGGYVGDGKRHAHPDCGNPRESREIRTCSHCGYPRRVKVTFYPMSGLSHHALSCRVCVLHMSAQSHEQTAAKLRAQAKEILAKRREKHREKKP